MASDHDAIHLSGHEEVSVVEIGNSFFIIRIDYLDGDISLLTLPFTHLSLPVRNVSVGHCAFYSVADE